MGDVQGLALEPRIVEHDRLRTPAGRGEACKFYGVLFREMGRPGLAATHLEQWIKNGYFPPDINAIEYTDANARFGKGEGVFIFNGDWQNTLGAISARLIGWPTILWSFGSFGFALPGA